MSNPLSVFLKKSPTIQDFILDIDEEAEYLHLQVWFKNEMYMYAYGSDQEGNYWTSLFLSDDDNKDDEIKSEKHENLSGILYVIKEVMK